MAQLTFAKVTWTDFVFPFRETPRISSPKATLSITLRQVAFEIGNLLTGTRPRRRLP
jgi:hypothetical protein